MSDGRARCGLWRGGGDDPCFGLQWLDMNLFVGMYYLYILVAMILLLNLLIALMGNTFEKIKEDSTLQYRRSFARRVLRLELIALPPLVSEDKLYVGTKDPQNGKHYYAFRGVDANIEGVEVDGGGNIFDDQGVVDADGDFIPDDEDFDVEVPTKAP